MAKNLYIETINAGENVVLQVGITFFAVAQEDPAVDTVIRIAGLSVTSEYAQFKNQSFTSPENCTFDNEITITNVSGGKVNVVYRY